MDDINQKRIIISFGVALSVVATSIITWYIYSSITKSDDNDNDIENEHLNNNKNSKKSLYERLGGASAMDEAIDRFYIKVLSDDRVKHWFAKTNMAHQHKQQKSFLIAAFGGPNNYKGRPMDHAHAKLVKQGLNDSHFDAIAENLQNTLLEMGVEKSLVDEVITAAASLREEILCRGKYAACLEKY